MIDRYYSLIYIIIIIFFAIPVCNKYYTGWTVYNQFREKEPLIKSLVFIVLIILFIGFRPNSPVFADGPGYWAAIEDHRWEHETLEDANYQFATKYLMSFMSANNFPPRLGFIVLAIVVYGGAFIAMRKMFPNDTLLAVILFCGAFCTFSGATNGIKNGMACSMFLCALAYRNNWKKCLLFLVLSLGFHHAMQLSIGAFVVSLFYKKTKSYYYLWFFSLIMAMLHVSFFQTLFAGFTDDHAAGYLITNENSWVTGFRLDFVLYSAAPLVLGWWIINKKNIINKPYQSVLNVYLVMNSIWLLCMYASFTNRFAGLSWTLFPMLTLEPLLNEKISSNQHKILVWFVIGQLSFNLLMSIIYLNRY